MQRWDGSVHLRHLVCVSGFAKILPMRIHFQTGGNSSYQFACHKPEMSSLFFETFPFHSPRSLSLAVAQRKWLHFFLFLSFISSTFGTYHVNTLTFPLLLSRAFPENSQSPSAALRICLALGCLCGVVWCGVLTHIRPSTPCRPWSGTKAEAAGALSGER